MTRTELFEMVVAPAIWYTKKDDRKWVRFIGQFCAIVIMFPWAITALIVMLFISLMLAWWDSA